MTTPGQSETTDLDVLRDIVVVLREIDGLNEGSAYLSAEPMFMGHDYPGDKYVQVIPGSARDMSRAGHGYLEDEVRVVVFKRLAVDLPVQDTERLTHESEGLLLLVQSITDKLTNNFLSGKLARPLRPTRRGPGPVASIASNWAAVERVFDMAYVVSFSDPQNTS